LADRVRVGAGDKLATHIAGIGRFRRAEKPLHIRTFLIARNAACMRSLKPISQDVLFVLLTRFAADIPGRLSLASPPSQGLGHTVAVALHIGE
jgi:hypothetical protein